MSKPFVEHRGGGKTSLKFESMASRWDSEWASSQNHSLEKLAENISWSYIKKYIDTNGRILEAGCGLAKWVAFLEQNGYEAYGLDYSSVAIENSLKIWPQLRLTHGDLRTTPYESNFFSGIVSFGAIEHDINGPEKMLVELYRILKSGGIMFCTVPCMNYFRRTGWMAAKDWLVCNPFIRRLFGRNPDDIQFYEYVFTPRQYKTALEQAGFTIVALFPLTPNINRSDGWLKKTIISVIHKHCPWCTTHMMGAICRK
ncbi:MAG: methyltransferase domain-containing protein [Elusimicrobiaceae bacterium]|nr:methyltransferase domain-containing protein [Elusimicrobiaceae bacterium]